jgi:hypothetical protein
MAAVQRRISHYRDDHLQTRTPVISGLYRSALSCHETDSYELVYIRALLI